MKIKGGNAYEKPGHQLTHSQEINKQGDFSFFRDFVKITWDHVWRDFICYEWAAQVWVITILFISPLPFNYLQAFLYHHVGFYRNYTMLALKGHPPSLLPSARCVTNTLT